MARGKKQTTDITEPVVDETIETTAIESPVEIETTEEIIPEEVVVPEKPGESELKKEVSVPTQAPVAATVPMPGGKYKVMVAGKKVLGMWGKEKAEQICRNYNK